MATGTVKFFNSDRGFGFITPEGAVPMCSFISALLKPRGFVVSRKGIEFRLTP